MGCLRSNQSRAEDKLLAEGKLFNPCEGAQDRKRQLADVASKNSAEARMAENLQLGAKSAKQFLESLGVSR